MQLQARPYAKIVVFLLLTFAFTLIIYYPVIRAGTIQVYSPLIMLCPGLAAIITQLIYDRSLRGLGWWPSKPRYLLASYAIPLLYCLAAYGVIWSTGLGGLPNPEFIQTLQQQYAPGGAPLTLLVGYGAIMATLGVILNCLPALGEELGWRGLLVPELVKYTSFTRTALISGLIWAVWHYPGIFLADYNNPAVSQWYSAVCFTALAIGMSFVMAWFRLKSGSLWPAVILHAAHNVFVQGIFTPLTTNTGVTPYLIGEFGVALPIATIVLGYLFWRRRADLPLAGPSATRDLPQQTFEAAGVG